MKNIFRSLRNLLKMNFSMKSMYDKLLKISKSHHQKHWPSSFQNLHVILQNVQQVSSHDRSKWQYQQLQAIIRLQIKWIGCMIRVAENALFYLETPLKERLFRLWPFILRFGPSSHYRWNTCSIVITTKKSGIVEYTLVTQNNNTPNSLKTAILA